MKRMIAIFLSVAMMLTLAACGGSSESNATSNANVDKASTVWRMTSNTTYNGDAEEKIEYVYDENGMPIEIISTLNGEELLRSTPTCNEKGELLSYTFISSGMTYELTATFDENGNRLTQTQTGVTADGIKNSTEISYTYDEQGNALTQTQKSSYDMGDGNVNEYAVVITNTYDDKGSLIRQEAAADGAVMSCTEITYNSDGKVIKQESYSGDGNLTNSYEISYEGNKAIYVGKMADGTVYNTMTRIIDDNGNTIEVINESNGMTYRQVMTWQEFPVK